MCAAPYAAMPSGNAAVAADVLGNRDSHPRKADALNKSTTTSFGPADLRILESALNQAWGASQSQNYEEDPAKAAEIYSSLARTIIQSAASGESEIQSLVARALTVLPAKE